MKTLLAITTLIGVVSLAIVGCGSSTTKPATSFEELQKYLIDNPTPAPAEVYEVN